MNVTVFRTIWNLSLIVIFYYLIIMSDFFMTSVHYVNDGKLRIPRAYNIHIFWIYSTKIGTIANCHRTVLNEIWILFQLLVRMSNYLFRFSELMNFSSSMMIDFWRFRCISRSNYTIERRNRFVVQLFRARLKLDRTSQEETGPGSSSARPMFVLSLIIWRIVPPLSLFPTPRSCALFSISMWRIERLWEVAAIVRSPVVVVFIVSALVGRVPVVRWTYSFFSTRDAIFSMLNVAFSVHRSPSCVTEDHGRGESDRSIDSWCAWKCADARADRVELPAEIVVRSRLEFIILNVYQPWVSLKTNWSTLLFVKICFLISRYISIYK